MIPDDEIKKSSSAVLDGLQVLFQAMLEGSQVAALEFAKIALELKSLCQAVVKKGN